MPRKLHNHYPHSTNQPADNCGILSAHLPAGRHLRPKSPPQHTGQLCKLKQHLRLAEKPHCKRRLAYFSVHWLNTAPPQQPSIIPWQNFAKRSNSYLWQNQPFFVLQPPCQAAKHKHAHRRSKVNQPWITQPAPVIHLPYIP